MTLPTFLGIGVPRAGTTWLYNLLDSHPEIYVPSRRKEIHFFDSHYERGLEWYRGFFPSDEEAKQYRAIGEITPHYLYRSHCPERIADMDSITRLLLILRDPVDRAYSHYCFRKQSANYPGTFEDFLSSCEAAIEWGFYSRYIEKYLEHFTSEQILVLIYEQAVTEVQETKHKLSHCLGVSVNKFPIDVGTERVNKSFIPRFRSIYALATSVARELRSHDLDWIIAWAKKSGVKRIFASQGARPPAMGEKARKYLGDVYKDEIDNLESLLQIDLECWKHD